MTSSRYSDRVRSWEQTEDDFLLLCRIFFLPQKGEHESKTQPQGIIHRWAGLGGAAKVVSDCLLTEMRRYLQIQGSCWKWKRGFTVCMFLGFYFVFFFTGELWFNAVGFLWPTFGGARYWNVHYFMLWILAPFPASFVRCYFTQANAFRGKFFYISTIYWMANFIFFKSGLELVFSDTSSEKEISASCEAGRYF